MTSGCIKREYYTRAYSTLPTIFVKQSNTANSFQMKIMGNSYAMYVSWYLCYISLKWCIQFTQNLWERFWPFTDVWEIVPYSLKLPCLNNIYQMEFEPNFLCIYSVYCNRLCFAMKKCYLFWVIIMITFTSLYSS